MRISLIPDSTVPLHVQLLDQLRYLILSGELSPGSRTPSETQLQRQLNISRSTVRQALSNAEAEGLIERVAGKGTFVARSPAGNKMNHLIGYVVDSRLPSSSSNFPLLSGAESAATDKGYRILFCGTNKDMDEENRLLDQLLRDEVGGILIWPVANDDPTRRLFQVANQGLIPIVLMDRSFPGLNCDYVTSHNYSGAYVAVQHLVASGHQRIAFLSHRPLAAWLPIGERFQGYQQALQDAGLTPLEPWLIEAPGQEMSFRYGLSSYDTGIGREIEQIAHYLGTCQTCTAIFAINDLWAMQTLKAAKLAGLRVPQDLSVVGFDDIELAVHLEVPLTTVAQDFYAIGKRAAELLVERIEGYTGPARKERMAVELKVRASTAAPATSE